MSYDIPAGGQVITGIAGSTVRQYYPVIMASDGQWDESGANADAMGVSQQSAVANGAFAIMVGGVTKVLVGTGGATRGSRAVVDDGTNGVENQASSAEFVIGRFLATGVAGDYVPMLIGSNFLVP